jgi:hypothetical protein
MNRDLVGYKSFKVEEYLFWIDALIWNFLDTL